MDTDKELHDQLLANKPEGASHEEDQCKFCQKRSGEGQVADEKILTQEQHETLLASAVQKAKLDAASAVDKEILTLNERAETAEAALKAKDAELEALTAEKTAREETDRVETLANDRLKLVRAENLFTDEQAEARKAQWAAMSEDGFKVYLEDLKETAKAAKGDKPDPAGKKDDAPATKFDGTRETAGEQGTDKSAVEAFFKSDALQLAELS